MDRKVDQQTMEQLLDVIEEMKAVAEERQAKAERKLFSPISIPYQLRDILPRYTKEQLDSIRKKLELKGLSSLKKQALIEALLEQIPNKMFKMST